jgi:hypothetical protein
LRGPPSAPKEKVVLAKAKRKYREFEKAEVAAVFMALPDKVKFRLMDLRELIFDTAAGTEGVGELEEVLRWGEPAYLTTQSKIGSLIRINKRHPAGDRYAIFFHCQTDLVETFRLLYPDFTFEGNRAITFSVDDDMPIDELRRCIEMALTYHRDKKSSPRPARGSARTKPA